MKEFMNKNFLLESRTAQELYHNYASKMPIFDYHSHIIVDEILQDKSYDNITQVWLYGDHYKWRAMRLFGIDEEYITGNKSDYEKFYEYAKMMPYLIGNPLYHWTHLELKRYFDVNIPLSEDSAEEIWNITKEKLTNGLTTRKMIISSNVTKICSTDDPLDTLDSHIKLKEDSSFDVVVIPTFRPDKGLEINKNTFLPWLDKLSKACNKDVTNYDDFLACLDERVEFFDGAGCVIADHGMEEILYEEPNYEKAGKAFDSAVNKKDITKTDEAIFKTCTTIHLAKHYYELGWTLQLHINAMRSNNTKMFKKLGADTGFDSILDMSTARCVSKLLDAINENGMVKTILYSLNPSDNYILATMMGNFAGGEYGTQVQFGAAWWFNDQKDKMIEHLHTFANLGVLPKFVGMLTDSRSFLSYTRHEYFRRILCNVIGNWAENGEYPRDMKTLGKIVEDISYNNSIKFINKKRSVK